MTIEEKIVQSLVATFEALNGKCVVARDRRVTADVPRELFIKVMTYAREELSYTMLLTITGLDLGDRLQAIYHLAREDGQVLNLRLEAPKEMPVIESVTPVFAAASLYERELVDLLGFQVEGLPAGGRYPLPDFWPEGQYPLRKDWKPESLNVCGGGEEKNE